MAQSLLLKKSEATSLGKEVRKMPRPERPQELNTWVFGRRPLRPSPGFGGPPPPGWEFYALDLLEYIADSLDKFIDVLGDKTLGDKTLSQK